jgi:enterochelin esterase-like enzyme
MSRVRQQANWPKGEIKQLDFDSKALMGNPWKDPVERQLSVYLPPGYDENTRPYIALWDLAAFTNSGPGHLSWRHHGENLPQRLDRLIHEEALPPVVVAMPDCYTSLGGNQYLNSPSVGLYEDYLVKELVPFLSENFNVHNDRTGRGVFGKSSGGYGAMVLAMRHPETWGAIASHAGDVGFELVYRPEFPVAAGVLSACHGDVPRFLKQFWKNRKRGKADYATLMTVAMAASYDPDSTNPEEIQLPFDLKSCEIDPERWVNWMAHDPLNLVEHHADALRSLYGFYLDVGNRDEYGIQYGTRRLSQKLEKLDVRHHFEEFEGTHMGMDWRLDFSLPYLAKALTASIEQDD